MTARHTGSVDVAVAVAERRSLPGGDAVVLADRSLEARGGLLGNNDGPGPRACLPEVAWADLDGPRLGVEHETGTRPRGEERVDAAYDGLDDLVYVHSHLSWDTTTSRGVRLLDPGSPLTTCVRS